MISVVIPLYNKEQDIARTLDSVLNQVVKPNEVIVVNDGSTDNSAEVVLEYSNHGVRLINQNNQGVSAARNAGVKAASSEYIAFLDADDLWYPHHLSVLEELIREYPSVGLFSTRHEICLDGQRFVPKYPYPEGRNVEVEDFFDAFSKGLSIVNSSTACVRRDVLLRFGGFPEDVDRGEDIITWCRVAWNSGAAHAGQVTVLYNRDASNRSEHRQSHKVPGSLIYLGDLIRQAVSIQGISKKSVCKLFDRIAFFTAAGMKANGNNAGIANIHRLAIDLGRKRLSLLLAFLSCVPSQLVTYMRKYRHSKINGNGRKNVPNSKV
ncbi:glycosyltransferase family A protein [Alcanivorax sp.]|uniref:glycosyltransferase family 2 protein n=1 Tax=Alcanivorax sp. TaxID=1872427 RepID=UPI00258E4CAE|nr:glycosyltransferase family A protein [Alcanivorax sp.]